MLWELGSSWSPTVIQPEVIPSIERRQWQIDAVTPVERCHPTGAMGVRCAERRPVLDKLYAHFAFKLYEQHFGGVGVHSRA